MMATLRTTNLQHPSAASPNIVLAADGSFAGVNTNGFAYAGTRYFFSDGTFDKTDAFGDGSGVVPRAIRVRMVGGGGAGMGAVTTGAGVLSCGGGGGGGAYSEKFYDETALASLSSTESVTRGAGGVGAAGAQGTSGGASSFATMTAPGGSFGPSAGAASAANAITGGVGGVAGANADFTAAGSGGGGVWWSFSAATFNTPTAFGGSSLLGEGGIGRLEVSAAGEPGNLYGGGGAGATNRQNQGNARAGGNGANGIVIIDIFV